MDSQTTMVSNNYSVVLAISFLNSFDQNNFFVALFSYCFKG